MLHVDAAGVPLTVANLDAASCWDRVIDGLLSFAHDVDARFDTLFSIDPPMPAAHTLRAWLLHHSYDPRYDESIARDLTAAEAAAEDATQRERDHVAAVRHLVAGHPEQAAAVWDRVLREHPRDIVAIRCAYFDRYERGDTIGTRQVAERALAAFDDDDLWRPHVLGLAAFARSETDDYRAAEGFGREAAERAPEDLWSVHAVAHVLEECVRPREGIRWIDEHVSRVDRRVGFARHLWWHKALYALTLDDLDAVLGLYDDEVSRADSDSHLDLCNRISLLARLQLADVDVGDRWEPLAEQTRTRIDDRRSLFFHAHLALAHAWAPNGDSDAVLTSVEEWARHDPRARGLGLGVVRAIVSWRADDPSAARRFFAPVEASLGQLGGSRAQRSLFAQLLV